MAELQFVELDHADYHVACDCGADAKHRLAAGETLAFFCDACIVWRLFK